MGIMRFKKGSTVEVLNTKEKDSPLGSWRIAKVISGNGHTYLVRYHQFKSSNSTAEERVPRIAIRPCPPPIETSTDWVAGDIVEVFEDMSWRPAQVSRVLVEDRYLLRLLHSSKTIITDGCFIRMWQSWQDQQWVVVREIIDPCIWCLDSLSIAQYPGAQNADKNTCFPKGGNLNRQCTQSGRVTRKRKLEQSPASTEEPNTKVGSKLRATIRLGRYQEMGAGGNMQEQLHDQAMHSPFHDRHNDSRSPTSSVGSCSIKSYVYRSDDDYASTSSLYLSSSSSEPKTFGAFGGFSTKVETEETNHELELQAMRSVMKEFYGCHPVSLEREELLKKLRLFLHVSDNEFSRELKNLMSK